MQGSSVRLLVSEGHYVHVYSLKEFMRNYMFFYNKLQIQEKGLGSWSPSGIVCPSCFGDPSLRNPWFLCFNEQQLFSTGQTWRPVL